MAEAAVSFAVETLGNLLTKKAVFLQDVEEQVQRLQNELKRMQCFLKDAEQKQAKDERVRNWISEIREVAHDAQDAIEIFILKVENRGLPGKCACFLGHLYDLNGVGKEIESIRKRLQDIERSRQTYGIQNLGEWMDSSSTSSRSEKVEWRRRLARFQNDKQVVGLNEDVELLLQNSILKEKEGLSITAILGMGGIGKSTLARKIYDHPAVAARFDCRAWVVVSSEFAHADVIKQIMLQLQNSEEDKRKVLEAMKKIEETMTGKLAILEMLQDMLREQLKGNEYFIVLDDVWEQTDWESLRSAFPLQRGKTSRLLFTSRNQIITKHLGYIHKMRLLNPDESSELLFKMALLGSNDGKCPRELESVGKEILKKCHGLPLAIMVVGGLLANEGESKSGWEKVLKLIKNYHLETNEISSNVSAILELSYHNLPPPLKACFLCLGFFKEDAIIQAKRLIHIWVAQGFISSEEVGGEEITEEIARSYLDELVKRNLVQVKDMSKDDRVNICHVHDLLRELSIRKAKEEIGLEILREDQGNSSKSPYKPRHRVFQSCNGKRIMLDSSNQNRHVRSLFFHDVDENSVAYLSTSSYWKSFELLRILDIRHLRRLTGSLSLYLPSWLLRLKNLEVLDLADMTVVLPDVKWESDSLRHFCASDISGPMRIDNWKNLETLKNICAHNLVLDNRRQQASCRVRKLGIITGDDHALSRLCTSLEKVETLVQLHLTTPFSAWLSPESRPTQSSHTQRPTYKSSDTHIPPISLDQLHHLTKLKLNGVMTESPTANMLPQNLSHLTLKASYITDDPMPELGKLPKLLYLKLYDAYDGRKMSVLRDGFPSLKVLSLLDMIALRYMDIEEGGMPELQRLEISDCPKLRIDSLPERIKAAAIPSIS